MLPGEAPLPALPPWSGVTYSVQDVDRAKLNEAVHGHVLEKTE